MLTDCYGVCVCDNAITISFTLRISSIFNCLTTSFFFMGGRGGGEEITGNTMTRMVGMLTSVRFIVKCRFVA